jgi:predicted dehydrogenase
MTRTRIGFVGTGGIAHRHIDGYRQVVSDRAVVTAVCDLRKEVVDAFADQYGIEHRFTDVGEMLASGEIDLAVDLTPPGARDAVVLPALEHGVHILVEKPLCTSLADVERLRAAAAAYASPVWVAMEYRYMPPVQAFLEGVHAGRVGTARMLAITEHRFPFLHKVDNWNRFAERTGGTLVEKACHFFDLMRLVMQDEPVRVYASGAADVNHRDESYDGHVPDILDNAFVTVDFARGGRALLNLCMFAEGSQYQEHMSVTGDVAKIECAVPVSGWHWEAEERPAYVEFSPREPQGPVREEVGVDPEVLAAGGHYGSTYYEHLRFAEVVRGNAEVEVTIEDGLRAVLMGLAAERSAQEHRPVELDLPAP